jgi:hypothetical protein
MDKPLDELYLVWLYEHIGNPRLKNTSRTYWNLARALFTTEFVWFVPNDDARCDDGKELRVEFLMDAEIPEVDPAWMDQGCSYLEMLIALARRMAYQMDMRPKDAFWILISNIGLTECNDSYQGHIPEIVEEVTDQLTFRTYSPSGQGGLFPLRYPYEDQTKVEIWYQMNAYILEND